MHDRCDHYNIESIFLQVEALYAEKITKNDIYIFDAVDSTNSIAKKTVAEYAAKREHGAKIPPFSLFIAESQTGGRGRLNRAFFSPEGNGIYMSLLFFPKTASGGTQCVTPGFYTCAAAVAVCRAIEKVCKKTCGIKWVNDVYFENKKICGILTEGFADKAGVNAIICGIGINVYRSDFPDDIAEKAGALFDQSKRQSEKHPNLRNELCAQITAHLMRIFDGIIEEDIIEQSANIMSEYRARSILIGKKVFVRSISDYAAPAIPGTVTGIAEDGSLELLSEKGEKMIFQSGEVSLDFARKGG